MFRGELDRKQVGIPLIRESILESKKICIVRGKSSKGYIKFMQSNKNSRVTGKTESPY